MSPHTRMSARSFCLRCKKHTELQNPEIIEVNHPRRKSGKITFLAGTCGREGCGARVTVPSKTSKAAVAEENAVPAENEPPAQ